MPRVTLIGYRGCGKSTVAEALARRMDAAWSDADAVLEERAGCSIADLVRDRGESAFRDLEGAILRELLAAKPRILATGGGVVLRPENRVLLRRAGRPVIWLDASAEVVRARLGADPQTASRRPALSGSDPLAEVAETLAAREPLYRECADLRVAAGDESADGIAEQIIAWLGTDGSEAGA